jgi:hypothetical protein
MTPDIGNKATAPGKIVATGRTKIIQPFETGVVRAIRGAQVVECALSTDDGPRPAVSFAGVAGIPLRCSPGIGLSVACK